MSVTLAGQPLQELDHQPHGAHPEFIQSHQSLNLHSQSLQGLESQSYAVLILEHHQVLHLVLSHQMLHRGRRDHHCQQ